MKGSKIDKCLKFFKLRTNTETIYNRSLRDNNLVHPYGLIVVRLNLTW